MLGFLPVPLANVQPENVNQLLDTLQLDSIILSGGNSIAKLDPTASDVAPERDAFEEVILDAAMQSNIPVLGVCRGMQMVNLHLGGQLSSVTGHVGNHHAVIAESDYVDAIPSTVNSYHNWAIGPSELSRHLVAIAKDNQGNIECFKHKNKAVAGIMWHPEREDPPKPQDINLLKSFLS